MADFEIELGYKTNLGNLAQEGAPEAQLVYGLLLDGPFKEQGDTSDGSVKERYAGLPWLVKAAQAGEPVAQYEVAHRLLEGAGCRRDEVKGAQMVADGRRPRRARC